MTKRPLEMTFERKKKQLIFESPNRYQIAAILIDSASRYQVTSVVTDREGNILKIYCLVEDNDC